MRSVPCGLADLLLYGARTGWDGEFDDQEETWYLDYTSSFTGGWVQMHLEGSYHGTSAP